MKQYFLLFSLALAFVSCQESKSKDPIINIEKNKIDSLGKQVSVKSSVSNTSNTDLNINSSYNFELEAILTGELKVIKQKVEFENKWRKAYVLFLDSPIIVQSKDLSYETEKDVREVQINMNSIGNPSNLLNKNITLSGTLINTTTAGPDYIRPVAMIDPILLK